MVIYRFVLFALFLSSSLFAVTNKDLPKLPAPVKILKKTLTEDTQTNSQKEITPKIQSITKNNYEDDDENTHEGDLNYQQQQLHEAQSGKGIFSFDASQQPPPSEQKDLAPGLKSHKKESKILPEKKTIPTQTNVLKGIILYGNKKLVGTVNLQQFGGFKSIGLLTKTDDAILRKKICSKFLYKEFNDTTVEEIEKIIFDYYQHYKIAIVTTNPQVKDFEKGILSIVITPAKLGEIDVVGNRYLKNDWIIDEIGFEKNEVIDIEDLDERVGYFGLNPFQKAALSFAPGKNFGYSDVTVHVGDRFPIRPYAGIDNQGLQLLGTTRTFYGINLDQVLALNDILSFQYTGSLDFTNYNSFTGDYQLFAPNRFVIQFFGGYVFDKYMPDNAPKKNGYSYQASARLRKPFVTTNQFEFEFGIGADFKETDNNLEYIEYDPVFTQPVSLLQFVATTALNWNAKYLKGKMSVSGYYSPGSLFTSNSNKRYNEMRLGANNYYLYGNADLDLFWYFKRLGAIHLKGKAQLSSANLLPSEEIALGGLATVRGYIENVVVGDSGYFGSAEYMLPPITCIRPRKDRMGHTLKDELYLLGFFDFGETFVKHFYQADHNSQPKKAVVASFGPGARYKIGDIVAAEIFVGYKLKKAYRDHQRPKINFSAMLKF